MRKQATTRSLVALSVFTLIRTDTTLDLSQISREGMPLILIKPSFINKISNSFFMGQLNFIFFIIIFLN
jgi:hypothetical protein